MSNIINLDFKGRSVSFTNDGWFNATTAGDRFGKRVQDYLDNLETKSYMAALASALNHANQRDLIRASRGRGGGTWFHPKLAVHFARWLSIEFAVWCDLQIDELLRTGQRQAMSVWQQLQAAQVAEKDSAAKGSYGSRLMNNRKREKAGLQRELARLEAQVVIPLFPAEAVA